MRFADSAPGRKYYTESANLDPQCLWMVLHILQNENDLEFVAASHNRMMIKNFNGVKYLG